MSPENNPGLFKMVGVPSIAKVGEEFLRRNMTGGAMAELSELFDDRITTGNPIADPTMFTKLYALSLLQRTEMGIAGFNPISAIDLSRGSGRVVAKVAPQHDEYTDDQGNTYRTRVVSLVLPDDLDDNDVDIFGLNFYQPDPSMEDLEPVTSSGLIMVNNRGSVVKDREPITGDISVIGIRDPETNDAKFYRVSLKDPSSVEADSTFPPKQLKHISTRQCEVTLPDGLVMIVEQLTGDLEREAVAELQASAQRLRAETNPTHHLSQEELAGVRISLSQRDY